MAGERLYLCRLMLASPGCIPHTAAAHEVGLHQPCICECFSLTIGDHSAQVEDSNRCEVIKRTDRDETESRYTIIHCACNHLPHAVRHLTSLRSIEVTHGGIRKAPTRATFAIVQTFVAANSRTGLITFEVAASIVCRTIACAP